MSPACICWMKSWDGAIAVAVCGCCAVKRQLDRLHRTFGYQWNDSRNSNSAMRLFPNGEGSTASKRGGDSHMNYLHGRQGGGERSLSKTVGH